MVKRCRDFGVDLAHAPVEVGPTAHFLMGGVVIDATCRTEVDGLFAAGEDTGGVHGANRLGGNGVAESTVFGGIAGDTIAEWVVGRPLLRASSVATESVARRTVAPLGRSPGTGENLYALVSNRLFTLEAESRDAGGTRRAALLSSEHVLLRCHGQANYTAVCPMGISPAASIFALRRQAVSRLFR